MVAHILHSKLFHGTWPKKKRLVRRMSFALASLGQFSSATTAPTRKFSHGHSHDNLHSHKKHGEVNDGKEKKNDSEEGAIVLKTEVVKTRRVGADNTSNMNIKSSVHKESSEIPKPLASLPILSTVAEAPASIHDENRIEVNSTELKMVIQAEVVPSYSSTTSDPPVSSLVDSLDSGVSAKTVMNDDLTHQNRVPLTLTHNKSRSHKEVAASLVSGWIDSNATILFSPVSASASAHISPDHIPVPVSVSIVAEPSLSTTHHLESSSSGILSPHAIISPLSVPALSVVSNVSTTVHSKASPTSTSIVKVISSNVLSMPSPSVTTDIVSVVDKKSMKSPVPNPTLMSSNSITSSIGHINNNTRSSSSNSNSKLGGEVVDADVLAAVLGLESGSGSEVLETGTGTGGPVESSVVSYGDDGFEDTTEDEAKSRFNANKEKKGKQEFSSRKHDITQDEDDDDDDAEFTSRLMNFSHKNSLAPVSGSFVARNVMPISSVPDVGSLPMQELSSNHSLSSPDGNAGNSLDEDQEDIDFDKLIETITTSSKKM